MMHQIKVVFGSQRTQISTAAGCPEKKAYHQSDRSDYIYLDVCRGYQSTNHPNYQMPVALLMQIISTQTTLTAYLPG